MLNYNTIIDFFQSIGLYNKEYFETIKKKTVVLNDDYEKIKDFIGFYPKYDNGNLIDYKLYLPPLNGLDNILIYIYEYTHALFPEDEEEIFPNIVESMFLKDYLVHPKYIKLNIEKTTEEIKHSDSEKHIIGKKIKLICLKEGLK
jgi:hypothetical protein